MGNQTESLTTVTDDIEIPGNITELQKFVLPQLYQHVIYLFIYFW